MVLKTDHVYYSENNMANGGPICQPKLKTINVVESCNSDRDIEKGGLNYKYRPKRYTRTRKKLYILYTVQCTVQIQYG